MKMTNKQIIFKISLMAVFSALSFALTYVSIPLPTGAKVHLGNFVCTLAALLCGGIVGGASGAIGMGLNDIISGYGWSTIVRTIIVKFLFGFVVGFLFQLLVKKEKGTKALMISLSAIFDILFVVFLILSITGTLTLNIGDATKEFTVSVLCPILLGIIGLLLTVATFLLNKLKGVNRVVLAVSSIGVLVNIVFEFILRWLLKGIELGGGVAGFNTSLVDSITKLPSNFITGIATVIITLLVYLPLYKALTTTGFSKYIINSEDEKELN